jgi:predicted RNA-binding Zn ribbon-like protein
MVSQNLSVKDGNIFGMELPADISDLAVEFANTLVHDGRGGVDDLLSSAAAARAWLGQRGLGPEADYESLLAARSATRALFAAAIAPHPASRADNGRARMPTAHALRLLQGGVDAIAPATRYGYDAGRVTVTRTSELDPGAATVGILALAVLELLASPAAAELRACQAPRCVRYFRKHRRQEWCKPSCANRARVARYAERHQAAADDHADPGR